MNSSNLLKSINTDSFQTFFPARDPCGETGFSEVPACHIVSWRMPATDYYNSAHPTIFYPHHPTSISMKKIFLVITGLIVMACAVMPASAFTMKSLSITVSGNGDAQVDMNYDLSFVEQSAIFFRIADPVEELKSAFDSESRQPVTVTQATSSSAHVVIPSFASVTTTGGKSTITTPSLSFERAQDVLNSYWFAPLVSPDFSPAVTTVTFPDGYPVTYYDQISIPSITHSLS
jgi:hypothetical protein